jgi:phage shock protein E
MNHLINDPKATIIDVRTPEEFMDEHAPDSINIPLHEIPERLAEIKAMSQPLIMCCRSGARSGNATQWLRAQGIQEVYNAGPWTEVAYYQSMK